MAIKTSLNAAYVCSRVFITYIHKAPLVAKRRTSNASQEEQEQEQQEQQQQQLLNS